MWTSFEILVLGDLWESIVVVSACWPWWFWVTHVLFSFCSWAKRYYLLIGLIRWYEIWWSPWSRSCNLAFRWCRNRYLTCFYLWTGEFFHVDDSISDVLFTQWWFLVIRVDTHVFVKLFEIVISLRHGLAHPEFSLGKSCSIFDFWIQRTTQRRVLRLSRIINNYVHMILLVRRFLILRIRVVNVLTRLRNRLERCISPCLLLLDKYHWSITNWIQLVNVTEVFTAVFSGLVDFLLVGIVCLCYETFLMWLIEWILFNLLFVQ